MSIKENNSCSSSVLQEEVKHFYDHLEEIEKQEKKKILIVKLEKLKTDLVKSRLDLDRARKLSDFKDEMVSVIEEVMKKETDEVVLEAIKRETKNLLPSDFRLSFLSMKKQIKTLEKEVRSIEMQLSFYN